MDAHANMAGMISCSTISLVSTWILDSRATNHMISYLDWLINTRTVSSDLYGVQLPNKMRFVVTYFGNHTFSIGHVLKGVLCVPYFHSTFMSVSRLSLDWNCSILFSPDYAMIQDQSCGKLTNIGQFHGGLYVVKTVISRSISSRPPRRIPALSFTGNE